MATSGARTKPLIKASRLTVSFGLFGDRRRGARSGRSLTLQLTTRIGLWRNRGAVVNNLKNIDGTHALAQLSKLGCQSYFDRSNSKPRPKNTLGRSAGVALPLHEFRYSIVAHQKSGEFFRPSGRPHNDRQKGGDSNSRGA